MTSPSAIRRMIQQMTPPAARMGTVTTGGSTPVVAPDGGDPVTIRYMSQGLVPAVGNRVLLVRASGAWVLTEILSTPAAVAAPVTRQITPVACWVKGTQLADPPGSWNSQVEYIGVGLPAAVRQGQDTSQVGADDVTTPQNLLKYATVLYFGALASLVPSGSTILDVRITFTRELARNAVGQPPLTYPRLYGSLYTTGSPPAAANPPTAVAGRGPLTPSVAIAPGQSTTIALPATWVTDWLSGAITSLHFYSDQRSDIIRSLGTAGDVQLLITYQPPPPEPT